MTLQKRLREARVYPKKGKLSGVVDTKTEKAIARYQKRYELPKTGIVDAADAASAMVGRIVVNLSQFRVRLIRNGKVVGLVPDRQRAAGLPDARRASTRSTTSRSTPPGPRRTRRGPPSCRRSRPARATRWAPAGSAPSAPAIGFHGTYADYSVGTAASHGCMRMHIPDVEALYEHGDDRDEGLDPSVTAGAGRGHRRRLGCDGARRRPSRCWWTSGRPGASRARVVEPALARRWRRATPGA